MNTIVKHKVENCKGCSLACAMIDHPEWADREGCPCFECLVKIMCKNKCKERLDYYDSFQWALYM